MCLSVNINTIVPSPVSFDLQYNKRDVCNDKTPDITPECWDTLEISEYLQQWWTQHETGCNTKYQGKGFVACY